MTGCLVCLRPVSSPAARPYHARCLKGLFGAARLPEPVDIDLARLHTAGLAMVGRTTVSGVQRKISANLSEDRQTLLVALGPGRFILKPQAQTFPELPQNELVTMRVAALAGVDVPPCGLLPISDGSMAYIVKRFDRIDGGGKLRQEDFCQLAGLRAKQKYDGSAELCARLVRRFASEPGIELLKLFRRVVVCWWTGNGDAHLKNFSLLVGTDGLARLSPAYDLLCTRLVIADDQLALPVGGRRDGLARRDFEVYGASCGLPPRAVARELGRVVAAVPAALALVASSPLSPAARAAYAELLASRAASLS